MFQNQVWTCSWQWASNDFKIQLVTPMLVMSHYISGHIFLAMLIHLLVCSWLWLLKTFLTQHPDRGSDTTKLISMKEAPSPIAAWFLCLATKECDIFIHIGLSFTSAQEPGKISTHCILLGFSKVRPPWPTNQKEICHTWWSWFLKSFSVCILIFFANHSNSFGFFI